jgi:hypothetical protein
MKFNQFGIDGIRSGRKTNTRRPLKHEPHPHSPYWNLDAVDVEIPHGRTGDIIPVEDEHGVDTGLRIKIKNTRIERLNDISEASTLKEGITYLGKDLDFGGVTYYGEWYENYSESGYVFLSPTDSFRTLWESIYGIGSFDGRWVWVYTFERAEDTP